jgi:hypothetical protein
MLWAVIEFLGIGMAGRDGEWLLHRVCARFAPGQIVVVLSNNAEERHAMLDVAAGKRLPDEGRLWLGGLAIARHSLGDLRARIAEIDFGRGVAERRSLFWNTLASGPPGRSPLNGFARLPRPNQRRAALEALDVTKLSPAIHSRYPLPSPATEMSRERNAEPCAARSRRAISGRFRSARSRSGRNGLTPCANARTVIETSPQRHLGATRCPYFSRCHRGGSTRLATPKRR